ncbi:MAG: glycosyltransferase family 1 protein, partial [Bacteroidales bacterium]|nr:glycosyltransferase family 1 protein [Bacteroidales bacterium]
TSMPEVGGDAACYVNPYDVDSIGAGMVRVACDAAYRAELIARGRLQRTKFSWDESARRFDEAIARWMAAKR